MNWGPIILSLELAAVTTVLLLVIGIPLAYLTFRMKGFGKSLLQTLLTMPLVLPPTVLGFYLLIAFSPESLIGSWLNNVIGFELAFSFSGIVLGSIVYSLPFMIQPIYAGLAGLPRSITEASESMGNSSFRTLIRVLLPSIKPAVITGVVLSFAHTIGEFGVVLMIGGSIPGKTKVASIALYEEVQKMNYDQAHQYAMVLFALTFVILLGVYLLNSKAKQAR